MLRLRNDECRKSQAAAATIYSFVLSHSFVIRHSTFVIIFTNVIELPAPHFDLAKTLDSGQVFHWEEAGRGFIGSIGDRAVFVEQRGEVLRAKVASASSRFLEKNAQDAHAAVAHYFALDHLLEEICTSFPDDPVMNAARDFCRGLRIIRQPKWECLATFICTTNSNI